MISHHVAGCTHCFSCWQRSISSSPVLVLIIMPDNIIMLPCWFQQAKNVLQNPCECWALATWKGCGFHCDTYEQHMLQFV